MRWLRNIVRSGERMDVRPWDRYAVGTLAWIEAHRINGKHGGGWLSVSKQDQAALWADAKWRAEFLKAKHAMNAMSFRIRKKSEVMK